MQGSRIGRKLLATALVTFGGTVLLSVPASAQKKEDVTAEAAKAAKAAADAKLLRAAAERDKATQIKAVVPAEADNLWDLWLSNGQKVRIQLRPDLAPLAVERIKTLTRQKFYDGLAFHRVIDGFMAQGGDPKGDGTGGSSLPDLPQEFNWMPHMRGTVAMARAQDPNSANSQFFIMFLPRPQLDHKYTVIGRVVDGMAGVDAIAKGEPPANPTKIVHAAIVADEGATAAIAPPPATTQPAALAPVSN